MQSREGWTRGEDGAKVVKGKTYHHLVEFTRACGVCSAPFSILVTKKIAEGKSDSNAFGLRNCDEHRRSRVRADAVDLETLRTANVTMREELTGLYEELRTLKSRLALYELPEALGQLQKVTATSGVLPKQFPWG